MTDDLMKRLRKRQEFEFIDGHKRVEWEDEDALEAADRIEKLEEALRLWACDCETPCTKGRCEAYQAKIALG
jgi:hypothetical protein